VTAGRLRAAERDRIVQYRSTGARDSMVPARVNVVQGFRHLGLSASHGSTAAIAAEINHHW